MLNKLLRMFDPRIGIAIVTVVVSTLVFSFVVGNIASNKASSAQEQLDSATKSLDALTTSMAALKDSGATNADELKGRIAQIEKILPTVLDDVYTTVTFIDIAKASEVDLTSFQAAPDDSGTPGTTLRFLDIPGVEGVGYDFTATGTPESIMKFTQNVLSSSKVFATFEKVALSFSAAEGLTVSMTGKIVVWLSIAPLEETTSDSTVPGTETTVPSSSLSPSTTVPSPDQAPSTTIVEQNPSTATSIPPAPSTTVQAVPTTLAP